MSDLIGTITQDLYRNSQGHFYTMESQANNPNLAFSELVSAGTAVYVLKVNAGQREHLIEWFCESVLIPSELIVLD